MTLHFRMRPELLRDFEQFQGRQSCLSPFARVALAMIGFPAVIGSGWILWQDGLSVGAAGFLLAGFLFLTLAFRRPRKNPSYRNSLENREITMEISEDGIRMMVNGRLCSQTRWKKIHGIFETQRCWYLKTGVNACYILDKKSAESDLTRFLEKKTRLRMISAG